MMLFTSDLHFGHVNIRTYMGRPWDSTEAMDAGLISNWNSRVQPMDSVYVLGDFMMGQGFKDRLPMLVPKLNGIKHLIRGNHDRKPDLYLAAGFTSVQDKLELTLWANDPPPLNSRSAYRVLLQHKPLIYIPEVPYDYVLHGHLHGLYKSRGMQIDVGVDVRNYQPSTFEELIEGVNPGLTAPHECLGCGLETLNRLQVCSYDCGKKVFEDEHEFRRSGRS